MQAVIGHRRAVEYLGRVARRGTPAHAYLLVGPPQVGKLTLARWFASALSCEARDEAPCGRCRACDLVAAGRHPDVRVVDLEAQRLLLGEKRQASVYKVELVRRLQADLALRPVEAARKVLILADAERMTPQAANAFLKTLEEPPPFVVLVLTAQDEEALLPTIRSRCQVLTLRPVGLAEIQEALLARGASPEEASRLARLSEGRPGWALQALENPEWLAARQAELERLHHLLGATRSERLLAAEELARDGESQEVLRLWAGWWRDVLLLQSGAQTPLRHADQRAALEVAARHLPVESVQQVLKTIQRAARLLRSTNVNAELVWDVLVLSLPHLSTRQANTAHQRHHG